MDSLTVFVTSPHDIGNLDQLHRLHRSAATDSVVDVAQLREESVICLTVSETSSGEPVGFMAVDTFPAHDLSGTDAEDDAWITQQLSDLHIDCKLALHVVACTIVPEHEVEAVPKLLRQSFIQAPTAEFMFMLTLKELTLYNSGLSSCFNLIASSRANNRFLYCCPRTSILTPLTIRRAKVEDHDDLMPILERSAARHPALAKLPEACRPDEPFALARVIAGQNQHNCVLVAAQGAKLVGFIVVTSDVEVDVLQEAFDLHAFDGLIHPMVYEECQAEATERLLERKAQAIAAERAARAQRAAALDELRQSGELGDLEERPEEQLSEFDQEQAESENESEDEQDNKEHGSQTDEAAPDSQISVMEAAAAEGVEPHELRAEIVKIISEKGPEAEVIAVVMLCMEEGYESQAIEFLPTMFDLFPDKVSLVLTLPHSAEEPPLLDYMYRLSPFPGLSFPELLYIFNREGLRNDFQVRTATTSDLTHLGGLLSDPNQDIQSIVETAVSNNTAVVATCEGHPVGFCCLTTQVDLHMLQSWFHIDKIIDVNTSDPRQHAEIDLFVMNPIFFHRCREFMAEVMRIMGRKCLYYALPPSQTPPDMLGIMQQLAPRNRNELGHHHASAPHYALYMMCKRLCFFRKKAINSQIVVVGASQCGLAALSHLLMHPELSFNGLSLLAPGGITVSPWDTSVSASGVVRLGLEARCALFDAEVAGLDRESHMLYLSDGSSLFYNLLVITAGLQDQTAAIWVPKLKAGDAEKESFMQLRDLYHDFTLLDAEAVDAIILYGLSLESYSALSILESRGAAMKVQFRAPNMHEPPLVKVLREAAATCGLSLTTPKISPLVNIQIKEIEGSNRLVGKFEEAGNLLGTTSTTELPYDLLVGTEPAGMSPPLFDALNSTSIVIDGRVVVDTAFRTNDPAIFAAGSVAQLSRRYASKMHLEHYHSGEVGTCLAKSIVDTLCDLSGDTNRASELCLGKIVGCSLPGGHTFLYAGMPGAFEKPMLMSSKKDGYRAVTSQEDRSLLQVQVAPNGTIHAIIYIGKGPSLVYRMQALIGLPITYLGTLLALQPVNAPAPDLHTTFRAPWLSMFESDLFQSLRQGLLSVATSAANGVPLTQPELTAFTHSRLYDFIRTNAADLAGWDALLHQEPPMLSEDVHHKIAGTYEASTEKAAAGQESSAMGNADTGLISSYPQQQDDAAIQENDQASIHSIEGGELINSDVHDDRVDNVDEAQVDSWILSQNEETSLVVMSDSLEGSAAPQEVPASEGSNNASAAAAAELHEGATDNTATGTVTGPEADNNTISAAATVADTEAATILAEEAATEGIMQNDVRQDGEAHAILTDHMGSDALETEEEKAVNDEIAAGEADVSSHFGISAEPNHSSQTTRQETEHGPVPPDTIAQFDNSVGQEQAVDDNAGPRQPAESLPDQEPAVLDDVRQQEAAEINASRKQVENEAVVEITGTIEEEVEAQDIPEAAHPYVQDAETEQVAADHTIAASHTENLLDVGAATHDDIFTVSQPHAGQPAPPPESEPQVMPDGYTSNSVQRDDEAVDGGVNQIVTAEHEEGMEKAATVPSEQLEPTETEFEEADESAALPEE